MVKIITDTTSCLPAEFARQHGIPIIPQIINFGTDSFYEGIQIDNPTFMKRLRTSPDLPKTAAPPPELFAEEFRRLIPQGDSILCIHPSTEVSGTVRSAVVAAKDFPNADIRVLDTRLIGSPIASLVMLSSEWVDEGLDINLIENRLNKMIPRCHLYFMVDTLEYLARGGRIGGASALIGSVLQIKPILCIQNGQVMPFEKERTHKRTLSRLKEIVIEQYPHQNNGYLSIMHADVPHQAHELANDLRIRLGIQTIPIYNVPPAIVVHGGPGILGVAFFTNQ